MSNRGNLASLPTLADSRRAWTTYFLSAYRRHLPLGLFFGLVASMGVWAVMGRTMGDVAAAGLSMAVIFCSPLVVVPLALADVGPYPRQGRPRG